MTGLPNLALAKVFHYIKCIALPLLSRHRMPTDEFTVQDVKRLVGPRRLVDVMDTRTQEASTMTLTQWAKYYNARSRQKLLNVISLEFSRTKLDPLVEPPTMVSSDWWERIGSRSYPENDV